MPVETFRWVITGAVAIATLCIVAMAVMMLSMLKVVTKLKAKAEGVVDRVEPMIDSVRFLINDNAPKINVIVTNVEQTSTHAREISVIAKDQAHRWAELGRDVTDRAKVQVARVDAAVDETVDQVQNLGVNMKSAVMKPVSEMSGMLAGIKAGFSAFANNRRPNVSRATQDEEMFI